MGPRRFLFEYALSYHGMIPERVETMTCICFKRDKILYACGAFHYKYLAKELYPVGLKFHQTDLGNFLWRARKKRCVICLFSKI